MLEYFHIPPKGGWEKETYYVCEVSRDYGNPVFEAILYSGFLNKALEPSLFAESVFSPLIGQKFIPLNYFRYMKIIRKIDMTIPNKGKQIKELNIFELKDHMKERPNARFD